VSLFTRCEKCGQDCESPAELASHIEKHHFNRSRRFFLMGALALPIARKIELAAAPAVMVPRYVTYRATVRNGQWITEAWHSPAAYAWVLANTHPGV
jgi:hypothetical protein